MKGTPPSWSLARSWKLEKQRGSQQDDGLTYDGYEPYTWRYYEVRYPERCESIKRAHEQYRSKVTAHSKNVAKHRR